MTFRTVLARLAMIVVAVASLWIPLTMFALTSPVVVLHYAASATSPVVYYFNENNDVIREQIAPGASVQLRTTHFPPADYYIAVSMPLASRDGVEIRQPFSRVDVYIGADTRVTRTVITTDYLARLNLN